ncbi:NAD(P)H-binding protein [Halosquirtibacter xylanolyticus]|uniref:NAD(P)H-binding protein n=1 Tax=Halosquirtibacter xylanolyticus TaxID=3374599 RepID=UPI003749E84C|nr:NAD(P)H-binding protein [Prolixibacteraceae bacterium]
MMRNKISILGCGWLGMPLGIELVKLGFEVSGSTTDADKLLEIEENGMSPFFVSLTPSLNSNVDKAFFNADILIVNIPPKRRDDIISFHYEQIKSLVDEINKSTIKKVLFVSSTSVYPNTNGVVDENTNLEPQKNSGIALRSVEDLLLSQSFFETTIIRFGGLIGYDRLPGRFLAGKKNLKNGDSPVNLIHRDDCIGLLLTVIKEDFWGKLINGIMPEHPSRREFYTKASEMSHLPIPEFDNLREEQEYKIISSIVVGNDLSYDFKYTSPLLVL